MSKARCVQQLLWDTPHIYVLYWRGYRVVEIYDFNIQFSICLDEIKFINSSHFSYSS